MERDQAIKLMQDLLRRVTEKKASDLFITAGFPPAIKIDGEIRPQSERALTPEQSATLVRAIMNDRQTKEFDATKECNFAISPAGIGRFRANAFVQQGRVGLVLRTIPQKIPTFDELGLPQVLKDVAMAKRGLVIFVGGTGTSMIGDFIEQQFSLRFDWPMGSAMSFSTFAASAVVIVAGGLLLRRSLRS